MIYNLSEEQILEMQITLSPSAFEYYYHRANYHIQTDPKLLRFLAPLDSGETYERPQNVYIKQKIEFITFGGQKYGMFFLNQYNVLELCTFYAPVIEYHIQPDQLVGVTFIRINDGRIEFEYD